jgi:hypothetical protein
MKNAVACFVTLIVNSLSAQQIVSSFIAPDTVCVNQTFTVQNTSTGTISTSYWEGCSNSTPGPTIATNLGGFPGSSFSNPVYLSVNEDTGNYYMFITNNVGNTISRLNFGNSLLNTPTATNLGNPSNALMAQPEGIYITKESGNWYGIVTGGTNPGDLCRLNFGSSLSNSPTAVSLGNVGNLNYPHNIQVFQVGGNYHALIINRLGNSLTRLSFGNSITNIPTGVNLGNIGNMNLPSQMSVICYSGNWYAYVCNDGSSTLTRLSFGNSLLNTPSGINIGNPSNLLNGPRGINLSVECGLIKGYIANQGNNSLFAMSLPAGPTGSVSLSPYGNVGSLMFPQTIERFRQGITELYFIVNVTGQTITRINSASGCNAIPVSTLQTPSPLSFGTAGTYTLKLTSNEGLFNNSSYCKQIVVIPSTSLSVNSTIICRGSSVNLIATGASSYSWSNGSTGSQITVSPTLSTVYTVTALGKCSASANSSVSVVICEGLPDAQTNADAEIYPNPFNGIITLKFTQPVNLELSDGNGRQIFSGSFNAGDHSLDLSEYQDAVYILKFVTASGSFVRKMVRTP